MDKCNRTELEKAFNAGYRQASAESTMEHTTSIGYYDEDADVDFDTWYGKNYV